MGIPLSLAALEKIMEQIFNEQGLKIIYKKCLTKYRKIAILLHKRMRLCPRQKWLFLQKKMAQAH